MTSRRVVTTSAPGPGPGVSLWRAACSGALGGNTLGETHVDSGDHARATGQSRAIARRGPWRVGVSSSFHDPAPHRQIPPVIAWTFRFAPTVVFVASGKGPGDEEQSHQ